MTSIRLVTDIPGPRSRELCAQTLANVARPVLPGGEIFIARGEGAIVEDVDGNRFIDLIGGVGCLTVGHSHPLVVAAVKDQADRFTHTDFSLIPYEPFTRLATRISDQCGGDKKVAFFNSGAEAVENAIKVARGATGKPGIICFEGAFHGRTMMAMTLTHRDVPYKHGFGPFAPEVYRVPFPGLFGASLDDSLSAMRSVFAERQIAGVIIEPILGEGGFRSPPPGFLASVAEMCRAHDAAFIADEIQTGYGRTGAFLATQVAGVTPDIVSLGKSIAAGLPLSAVVSDPRFIDALAPNALGGTYPGNPVACAAALAVLDVIEQEHLFDRAVHVGEMLMDGWSKIASRTDAIADVRGTGAMVGVEFADPRVAKDVIKRALQGGVIAMYAGRDGDVVRHLMPLVITDDQLTEALGVLDAAVEAVAG